ncbi:MAG: ankyrin repeat domain-containing protein [Acidobacteria bacterium]|nr:ankyrin repeat domain-containing protein [Acidobacteriota bacterium]
MRRSHRWIALAALCAALTPSTDAGAPAQGRQANTLRGGVGGAQGLGLPGVTVTVSSPSLRGTSTTVTNANGAYELVGLPGEYSVVLRLDGFEDVARTAVVSLDGQVRVNAVLALAGVGEAVEVRRVVPTAIATIENNSTTTDDQVNALSMSRSRGDEGVAPRVAAGRPPVVLGDSRLLRAKTAGHDGDSVRLRTETDRIVLLRTEHQLNLAAEFRLRSAKAARASGLPNQALQTPKPELLPTADAQPVPECDLRAWNTGNYLGTATADGVRGCIEAGADPNDRGGWSVTPLHRAAASNANPEVIRWLLAAGADPNARDGDRETALHWAAEHNENPAVAQALLAAGADVSARRRSSVTPLHQAAATNKNPRMLHALLAAGADPNARDSDKETPLHWAARYNEEPAVTRALLAAGADVGAWGWSVTPLHQAAEFNENPAVIRLLLAAGADPNARDGDNETPFHEVTGNNPNPEVFDTALLRRAWDERQAWSITPLHRAAGYNENPLVVQLLLAAGADPNALDAWNSTPLRWAQLENNVAVIDFLLSDGRPPILSTQDCRMWHTDVFFETATVEAVQACLAVGADPNGRGRSEQTPLHRAARFGEDPAVVEVLLETGADPEAQDAEGKTALHWAARNEHVATIEVLLVAGADPNARAYDDVTPLHEAKAPVPIEALVAGGADPNARTNWRNIAPLHLPRNAAAVRALLAAGADVDAAARGGPTPLYVAALEDRLDVIEALLEAGADPMRQTWGGDFLTPLSVAGPAAVEIMREAVKTAGQDCTLWNTKRYFQATTPESVAACLRGGADLEARDSRNHTPLHQAALYNANPAVLQLLLDAGVDLEARSEWSGHTPLMYAATQNTLAVLQVLLEAGADVEARNNRGDTPLHEALTAAGTPRNRINNEAHFAAVFRLLIGAGADVKARSRFWGQTVLERATPEDHPRSVLEVLMSADSAPDGPISIEGVDDASSIQPPP